MNKAYIQKTPLQFFFFFFLELCQKNLSKKEQS
jgi:hypothetical protein